MFKNTFNTMLDVNTQAIAVHSELKTAIGSFTQLSNDALLYFFTSGNHNIEIINAVIDVAYSCRGIQAARYVAYLETIVPHLVVEKKMSDGKLHSKMTSKKKDSTYLNETVELVEGYPVDLLIKATLERVLTDAGNWYDYGKDQSVKAFSEDALIAMVLKKLAANDIDVSKFATHLITKAVA
jgi:hypothetical protein